MHYRTIKPKMGLYHLQALLVFCKAKLGVWSFLEYFSDFNIFRNWHKGEPKPKIGVTQFLD